MKFVNRWQDKIDTKVKENVTLELLARHLDKELLTARTHRASLLWALAQRINVRRNKYERYAAQLEVVGRRWREPERLWEGSLWEVGAGAGGWSVKREFVRISFFEKMKCWGQRGVQCRNGNRFSV